MYPVGLSAAFRFGRDIPIKTNQNPLHKDV
jgi:hypothetical protein